ncbi:MAG: hypothetical protein HOO96_41615, partial [Polyangiaceae bacterium]|nr:hypothetical protein [Polyangiaceae bacterium]
VVTRSVRLGAEVTPAYDYAQVVRVAGARSAALNACVNASDFDPATDADSGYEMHYDASGHVDHVTRHEPSHTSVSPCIKTALNGLALGTPKAGGASAVVLVVRTK